MNIVRAQYISIYAVLITIFFLFSPPLLSSNQLQNLIEKTELLEDDTAKVNRYNEIAKIYIDSSFVNSLKYAQKANKLASQLNYENGYITSLSLLADANDYLGRYSEAQKLNYKILDFHTKKNDEESINSTNINIGIINYYQGNYNESIEYTFKALSYYQKINDVYGISICYNNLANVYSDQLNYNLALKYYFKALAIDEKSGTKEGITLIKGNIGEVYIELNEYDKAAKYLESALKIAQEIEDEWQEGNVLAGLGNLLIRKNEEDKALNYLLRALEINANLGALAEQAEVYELIYTLYEKKGDYPQALHYLKLFNTYNDSIYNKQNADKIAEMNAIYDIKEKEQQLEAQESIAAYQKNQKVALLISMVLLLIIIGISVKGNLSKKKVNETLAHQKVLIETKNRDITDSIQYAKQIQSAILPSNEAIKSVFPENFVFYKPKDIVAGDFYWMLDLPDKTLFAVADCTGHGVPGAMVSVVCHSALNRAVKEFGLTSPALILDKVTHLVIETFEKNNANIKDGMDIALCSFQKQKNELEFAGANNSIYIVKNGELTEIKSDKQPVGKFVNTQPFTNHKIKIGKNDSLYLFTDGYSDQFGGPKGKKLKYKAFKELLIDIHQKGMREQRQIIKSHFNNWKGNLEQIDDVCVVGIKYNS